jgi:capsular exopolysaccharide synthesis family protein
MDRQPPSRPEPAASDEPRRPPMTDRRGEDGVIDWPVLRAAVLGRWWIVVLGVVVGLAASEPLVRLVDPTFEAQATIWMDGGGEWGPGDRATEQVRLFSDRGWRDVIHSHAVLVPVVEELRLQLRPDRPAHRDLLLTLPEEGVRPGSYELRVSAGGDAWTLLDRESGEREEVPAGTAFRRVLEMHWAPPPEGLGPDVRVGFRVERTHQAADRLSREMRERMEGAFLRVELRGPDPELVAATVNGVAESFITVADRLHRARIESVVSTLGEQVALAGATLREAELALEDFRVRTISRPPEDGEAGVSGVRQTRGPLFERYHRLRLEAEELRQEEVALQRAVARTEEEGRVAVETLEAIPSVRASSELSGALELVTSKRMALRALGLEFTEESRTVREATEDLRVLEEVTVPALVSALLTEIAERRAAVEASADRLGAELREIPGEAVEETRLERRFRSAENLFDHLQDQFEAARLVASVAVPEIRVLDAALAPHTPSSDPRGRLRLLAVLFGLGLGLWGALLRERLDSRLRHPDQVHRELELPILATIPRATGRLVRTRELNMERAREAFRTLRLALLHQNGHGPAEAGRERIVCTVTSPGPGEGKSFTTGNLALSFGELGRRTLVIDGDVRRGTMHRHFDVDRRPGLTDHLAGKSDLSAVLRSSAHPLVDVIPSGSRLREAPELLGGERMRSLIEELGSRYDVLLIDSSPLAASVDPHLLATLSGAVLLVVRSGTTDRAGTGGRVDELRRLPVRVLGAVLNAVPASVTLYGLDPYRRYLPGYGTGEEPSVVETGAPALAPSSANGGEAP